MKKSKLLVKYLIVLIFFPILIVGNAYVGQARGLGEYPEQTTVMTIESDVSDDIVADLDTYSELYSVEKYRQNNISSELLIEKDVPKNTVTPVNNLGVVNVTATTVKIAWENTVQNENSVTHSIYVNSNSVSTINGTETSYTISNLNPNTEYRIYIITELRDNSGDYVQSETVNVKTQSIDLNPVYDLRYTSATGGIINIAWTNPNNNPSNVEHWVYVNGEYVGKTLATATTFTITNRTPGVTYSIFVITEVINNNAIYAKSATIYVTPSLYSSLLSILDHSDDVSSLAISESESIDDFKNIVKNNDKLNNVDEFTSDDSSVGDGL